MVGFLDVRLFLLGKIRENLIHPQCITDTFIDLQKEQNIEENLMKLYSMPLFVLETICII